MATRPQVLSKSLILSITLNQYFIDESEECFHQTDEPETFPFREECASLGKPSGGFVPSASPDFKKTSWQLVVESSKTAHAH
jgi:hypothetical protein